MKPDHLIVTALTLGALLGFLIGDVRGFAVEPLLYVAAGVAAAVSFLYSWTHD